MTENFHSSSRIIAVSIREARMSVGRILLTCGVPSGYVHGVGECVLLSQALGLGGFQLLMQAHVKLNMGLFKKIRVTDLDDRTLLADGGRVHAWLLAPTIMDLAVDIARKSGRAVLRLRQIAEAKELGVLGALASRYGAAVTVSRSEPIATADEEWLVTVTNTSLPRNAEQWDPLLLGAIKRGFAVEESMWRAVHALSNTALAKDSVVSRRHAGPIILKDDGTVLGRPPADDDFDVSMLSKVPEQSH